MEPVTSSNSQTLLSPDNSEHEKSKYYLLVAVAVFIILLILLGIWYLVKQQKLFFKKPDQKEKQAISVESLTVKRVDQASQTGEFVINDLLQNPPTQTVIGPGEQIAIDAEYYGKGKRIIIKSITKTPQTLSHQLPPIQATLATSFLKVEQLSRNKVMFQTTIPLINFDNAESIPFTVNLPYDNDFTLNVYSNSGELLITKAVKL